MQRIDFRAMGCHMLAVIDSDEADAIHALHQVPAWFAEWERLFSRFRPDSELSQLNANTNRVHHVSESLWQVIELSLIAAENSMGLVTPTVLDALKHAGYDRSFELISESQSRAGNDEDIKVPSWTLVECDAAQRTILLPDNVHLDLGGIAKGWCADQASQRLSAFAPSLIDAGGDMAIGRAMADGGHWHVALADPFNADNDILTMSVDSGGIATSGRDHRQWTVGQLGGQSAKHHIIDPRTGLSAQTDVMSATILAKNTLKAEIAAKVVLILGADAGLDWLECRPELAGCVVTEEGCVRSSVLFSKYIA